MFPSSMLKERRSFYQFLLAVRRAIDRIKVSIFSVRYVEVTFFIDRDECFTLQVAFSFLFSFFFLTLTIK